MTAATAFNRRSSNVRRARFTADEVVSLTLDFYRRNYIEGLFLSSGIIRNSDYTMQQLIAVAKTLRVTHKFAGYIHLKTIPDASQPLSVWRRKRWIYHEDPRGWFQWYCRYYMGRRSLDDARQIRRWRQMARHVGQIRKGCADGDLDCRRRQRQALVHWAYDSRKI